MSASALPDFSLLWPRAPPRTAFRQQQHKPGERVLSLAKMQASMRSDVGWQESISALARMHAKQHWNWGARGAFFLCLFGVMLRAGVQ